MSKPHGKSSLGLLHGLDPTWVTCAGLQRTQSPPPQRPTPPGTGRCHGGRAAGVSAEAPSRAELLHLLSPHGNPRDVRFSVGGGDLEAVSSVFTVHGHHGAVVQVLDQTSSHGSPGLTHEIPALGEEVQSLPGSGDQPCFTVRIVFEKPISTRKPCGTPVLPP